MPREQGEDTTAHTTGGRPRLRAPAGAAPACRLHVQCLGVLVAAIACLARARSPSPSVVRRRQAPPRRARPTTRPCDGLDIHFIHVRSRHPNALPLIMTHGWPGSVFELLKTIGPLTDPTAHGGRAEDAFDLVLPSMPGYGFSEKPKGTGWSPDRIARAWDVLMTRLGYTRYVAQGGDWGAIIADVMGRQAPPGLLGIHVNRQDRAATIPPDVAKALSHGEPAPAGLTAEEWAVFDQIKDFSKQGTGYAVIMATRPQTIGYGLADSPVGLAAWVYDTFAEWVFTRGDPERSLTRDDVLDNITLYWVTNTAVSSARLYWENTLNFFAPKHVALPVAVSAFPDEIYAAPRRWAERAYPKLIYYNKLNKGGHFAAWEQPQLFTEELRAAFKSLRELEAGWWDAHNARVSPRRTRQHRRHDRYGLNRAGGGSGLPV